MKVLLTGATGFVGRALVSRLAVRPDVDLSVAVRSLSVDLLGLGVLQHVAILDGSSDWGAIVSGADVVIHAAARVHVMKDQSEHPLFEFRRVNVEGTLNLARQAAAAGVRRFIFLSSIKVNGEGTELGCPFTAEDVPVPRDSYGVSKMEAEEGLRELSAQTAMEVVIIRPPLVYGYGVKANFASMMRWLKRGIPLPFGAITTNRRSLVYVENLVELISVCIDHPNAANQTFLVSDDEDVSTTMLLQRMAKALGCPARLVNLSPTLIKLAAKLVGKPRIADRLCGSLQLDITKTKELLGWKPKFSFDDGLIQTARPMASSSNK